MSKETRTFKAGETLFNEGDPSECAYMIKTGRVELLKSGRQGQIRVGLAGKGELVGEMGVLDQGPRTTSARAETAVRADVIPREDFMRMLESEPQAAIKIMTHMAKRLRDSDELLADQGESSKKPVVTGSGPAAPGSSLPAISNPAGQPATTGEGAPLVPLHQLEPQVLPMQHVPNPASLQKPGLLNRLVGAFKGGKGKIRRPKSVAVTSLSLEAEYDQRPYLLECLAGLDGLTLRPTNGDLPPLPEGTPARDMRQTRVQSRPLLASERVDLLVWGGEDPEGRVIYLYFTAKNPPNMDQPGFCPQDASLVVPGDFDETWLPLIKGALLAAASGQPSLDYPMMPLLAEQAAAIALQPPEVLLPAERAKVRAMFGHLAAQAGVAFGRSQLVDAAIQCYQAALPELPREDVEDWGVVNRALALLLAGRGEKTNDEVTLRRAADSFVQALGTVHRAADPEGWGNLQARLAGVWFRVDMVSGDAEALRKALTHYQAALTVFPKEKYPWRWADIMTAIGQVMQVYGDHLKSVDILRKAVEICDSALEIRSAQIAPLLYAATRNNMGSALFLLARHTNDVDYVRQAEEAFIDALTVHRTTGSGGALARTIAKNLERAQAALERLESRRVAQPSWATTDRPKTSLE